MPGLATVDFAGITIALQLEEVTNQEREVQLSKSFNDLQKDRYPITVRFNDSPEAWWRVQPGNPYAEPEMTTTYRWLIEQEEATLISQHAILPQTYRNRRSTLMRFLQHRGRTIDTPIGPELDREFDSACNEFLQSAGLSGKAAADKRYLLASWKTALTNARVTAGSPTPRERVELEFHVRLRAAVDASRISLSRLSAESNVPIATLIGWYRQKRKPFEKNFSALRRIETVLGLARDDLVRPATLARPGSHSAPRPVIASRVRHGEQVRLKYRLPLSDVGPQLRGQWAALFDYKTSHDPELERSTRGKWRLVPSAQTSVKSHAMNTIGASLSASADIYWSKVASFLGMLRLDTSSGGLALPTAAVQTLAWLAVPRAIEAYFRFREQRSEGAINTSIVGFASFVLSLTHPKTGWLTQHPELLDTLPPAALDGLNWNDALRLVQKKANNWTTGFSGRSRDPSEPIRPLLDLPAPLAPVFSAVERLDEAALAELGGTLEAAKRKQEALLLTMLVSNPLRKKNYMHLSVDPSGSGNLYRSSSGSYRIRLDNEALKNWKAKQGDVYDAPLPAMLTARLEEFLQTWRPILLQGRKVNTLFVNPASPGERWNGISDRVREITSKMIPGCAGFGMHGFRHLVATAWLKCHPEDFLTVSELLNDKLETVLKAYAHLRKDDSFGKYESYLIRTCNPKGPAR